MSSVFHALSTTGASLLVTCSLLAQDPGQEPTPLPRGGLPEFAESIGFDPSVIHRAYGVTQHAKGPIAGGPAYEAEFEADRVVYVPAMPTSPRRVPLVLRTTHFGRGAADRAPSQAVVSTVGDTVLYTRNEFVESYESREHGIKQNFTFDRLPHGDGDLVVRLQVETELGVEARHGDDEPLEFRFGPHGGATIGKVVGIDAAGRRADGTMHYEGGALELRLPERFVESAALPLVLDPFVGTVIVPGTSWNDRDIDVAYDASNDVYLVTWSRELIANGNAVRGHRISPAGALVGSLLSIESSATNATGPRVANVNAADAFLVVYVAGGDVLGRAVAAADGAITPTTVTLRDTVDTMIQPDVGGEATTVDNEAIVIWENANLDEIEAKQVTVNGAVSPPTLTPFVSVLTVATSSATWSNSWPCISKSGGSTGVHCIVWSRNLSGSSNTLVRAALVSRNLTLLDDFIAVTDTSAGDCDFPQVDGDGRNWIVAWEKEDVIANGDNDVQARSIGYDPNDSVGFQGFLQSPIVDVENDLNDNERGAQVAWMGNSAVVMYEDEGVTPGVHEVYVQPVDLFTGVASAPRVVAAFGSMDHGPIRAASKASGGSSDDQALVVWTSRDTASGDNELSAIRFRADDGVNTELGGGCGAEGVAYADCAIVGNSDFRARLRSATPNQQAFWVLSTSRIDLPCSFCTLVPDPFTGFVVPRTLDSRGDADVALPIPGSPVLTGIPFYQQWLIADLLTPECVTLGADLSKALRTNIQ